MDIRIEWKQRNCSKKGYESLAVACRCRYRYLARSASCLCCSAPKGERKTNKACGVALINTFARRLINRADSLKVT